MSSESFEYNNPAGRLYEILKNLSSGTQNQMKSAQFCERLKISPSWEAVFQAMEGIREDYHQLVQIIEGVNKSAPPKHKLWKQNLDDIRK